MEPEIRGVLRKKWRYGENHERMGAVEIFSILITVVVVQLCKFVKIHKSIHLKRMNGIACKSYINKQKREQHKTNKK